MKVIQNEGSMDAIDHNNALPLYYQIKEYMKQKIKDEAYRKGEKLPTEMWLSNTFKVSRVTVRRAISELVREGVLEQKRGQGVYVSERMGFNRPIQRLTSQFEDLVKSGIATRSKILLNEEIKADAKLSLILQVDMGHSLRKVHRLRYADELLFSEQVMYINSDYLPGWNPAELENGSFYRTVEEQFNLKISHANQTISAVMPSQHQLSLFALNEPVPLIYMQRTTFLEGEIPVEYTATYHIASGYRYTVTLFR